MASSDLPATSEVLLQTDASKHILDTFLGQGWDTWGTSLGGSQASELMLEMFSAFNLIALAVVSALFIWVLAVAVAGTAHEGTPFGKRYSSLWMPLRFVGAMGALAPIFKGLSLFQVAILACIGFSINLGNYVWELGTDYFVEHGGQLSPQAPDHNVTHYAAITNGALESLTLQYYLNERRGMNITPGGEWKYSGNWFQSGGEYKFIFNGNAGSITVSCVDESDALCRGKVNAVGAAISALSPLVQQLADPDTPASSIEPRALYDTANQVNTTILSGLQSYAQQGQLQGKLNKFRENAAQYGWFIAGSSYWSIAWINQEVREAMYSGITYSPHEYTVSELQALMHGLRDYEAAKERVANYIKTAYASRRGISDTTATPSVTDEGRAFDEICNWLRATLNQLVAGNILPIAIEKLSSSDPIMTVSDVGDYLIGSAWGLASALGVVDVAHSMGKALPFVGKVVPNLDKYISFALFTVFLPLLLYGLALAYYLPAIPFIRWISALVGWIILVVEALVAAPLWLCAHALPESARPGVWPRRSASWTWRTRWARRCRLWARSFPIWTSTSVSLCSRSFCHSCSMAWLWLIICPPFRSSAGFQLSSAGLFWWWKLWSRPRSGSVPMPCPKGTALRDSTANGATSCCSASLFVRRLWSADSSPPSSS